MQEPKTGHIVPIATRRFSLQRQTPLFGKHTAAPLGGPPFEFREMVGQGPPLFA
jgi:hypothetical protein